MKVGWNRRYLVHFVTCEQLLSGPYKLLMLMALLTISALAFPTPTALVFSELSTDRRDPKDIVRAGELRAGDNAVEAMETFLEKYKVDEDRRERVARAIIVSSRKHNLDPKLVASVMIVESQANPFAISSSDAIGIMQIHLPTWGQTALKQGINLFKLEDNIDFGVRILKDYVRRFGVWGGVRRYRGWDSDSPESIESAEQYTEKIHRLYDEKPASAQVVR
jgi:hypothetical protein